MFRGRRRKQSDFSAEVEAHLQLEADRLKEQGLSDKDARLAARRAFGNLTRAQERFYESQHWRLVEECWRDVRFGLRMLLKNPGSTAVAVLALALGIGMNTAIFSVLNAALLKFLPVRNPNELVMLTDPNASEVFGGTLTGERSLLTYSEFVQLRDHTATLSGLCASQMQLERWPVYVVDGAQEEAHGRVVSENYFQVFGVEPAIGHFFTQQDAAGKGKDPYVVISYDYWQRRFNGNPAVLGVPMRFYRATLTIIGVAAKGFRGETVGQDPDLWLPMLMQPLVMPGADGLGKFMNQSRDKAMWLHVFGRRKSGVTIRQVQAEVNVLFRRILEADYPAAMPAKDRKEKLNQHIAVKPVRTGAFHGRDEFSEQWTVLSILAALVLFIACANVANLLLARATARSREVVIRLSIGAAKERLIRQFLTESLLLAALGGIAGLCVAQSALRVLLFGLSQSTRSLKLDANLDPRVLGFMACATLFTGILFGLAPAFQSTRIAVNQNLKETSRRLTPAKALIVVQVALSFLLVLGAGLFLRTLWNLQAVSLGYPQENLLLVTVDSSIASRQGARLDRELIERIRQIPGVHAVTYSDRGLFTGFDGAFPIWVEGFTPHHSADIGSNGDFVGPGYFSSLGVPILLGREIGRQDTANTPRVCVVNEAFAKHFGGGNLVGKHIGTRLSDGHGNSIPRSMLVVGVVKDFRVRSLRGSIDPKFYAAAEQTGGGFSFEIRTAIDPDSLLNAVRKTILTVDGGLSIQSARTLRQVVEEQNAQPRLIAELCTIFGVLALILAATGIYGVLSYSVARRTNEIGIRMALGADRGVVTGMILQEIGLLTMAGMLSGLAAAAALARLAAQLYGAGPVPPWSLAQYQAVESATQLYGLRAMDPLTIGAAALILCAAALIAAYLPAARAARVDPIDALRHD
jgi:predicted permease